MKHLTHDLFFYSSFIQIPMFLHFGFINECPLIISILGNLCLSTWQNTLTYFTKCIVVSFFLTILNNICLRDCLNVKINVYQTHIKKTVSIEKTMYTNKNIAHKLLKNASYQQNKHYEIIEGTIWAWITLSN